MSERFLTLLGLRTHLADGTYLEVTGYKNAQRIDELPTVQARGSI